jgi:hypothetical protein
MWSDSYFRKVILMWRVFKERKGDKFNWLGPEVIRSAISTLALNSQSCLSLISAGITGVYHHTWL